MGIFEPYRAIGYVTAEVPFSVQRLGTETFVTVSVGKAWQVYDCAKLTLAMVGPQLPKKIRALASYRDYTFAAFGTEIGVFKRSHQVWDFKGREVKSRWEIGRSVIKIVYHRTNGLLATVADDKVIRLFDVVAVRMVRKFEGHTDRITDLCFSEDGKWLLSSSMDGTLRIWDVILARQIDALQVDVCVTAVSLSSTMDILATSHVDQNGVYLWVNQTMFSGSSNIESYASGKNVRSTQLPSISSKEESEEQESIDDAPEDQYQIKKFLSTENFGHQLPNLVTLSLLPRSQWQSLTNLDIIKVRNKPIEPPKKPEKAPFFLPSTPSLSGEILFKPYAVADGDEKDVKVQDLTCSNQKNEFIVSIFSSTALMCSQ